jgi:hypothetical protein
LSKVWFECGRRGGIVNVNAAFGLLLSPLQTPNV